MFEEFFSHTKLEVGDGLKIGGGGGGGGVC
jgi:hypothetical protein